MAASAPRVRRWWTEAEDQILRQEANIQLNQGALKDWNQIASKLPGRTNKDCRKRWSKVCEKVNKGAWNADEDRRLESAVDMYGKKWTHVAAVVGTRHSDQCAKRWQHSLDPSLDHGEWTPEDDDRLAAAVAVYGRNWKEIGERRFPARSATDIKNRYVIVERKRRQALAQAESHQTAQPRSVPDEASGAHDQSEFVNRISDPNLDLFDLDFDSHPSSVYETSTPSPFSSNRDASPLSSSNLHDRPLNHPSHQSSRDSTSLHSPPAAFDPATHFLSESSSSFSPSPAPSTNASSSHQPPCQHGTSTFNPSSTHSVIDPMTTIHTHPDVFDTHTTFLSDFPASTSSHASWEGDQMMLDIPCNDLLGGLGAAPRLGPATPTPTPTQEWTIGGDQIDKGRQSGTMLVLEDVQTDTLCAIVSTLLASKTRVKMKLYNKE